MSRRRGATGLVGILPVDKPAGMTSHDVVSAIRRSTGERRIGHAGTLDPLATGLLVVLVGPATRLAPWLTASEKTYEATIVFGSRTDTDDSEGTVIATADVAASLEEKSFARETLDALVRDYHLQVPPAFSALKVHGKTAYREARHGRPIDLEPRPVEVLEARVTSIRPGPPLEWGVELTVSKGTYIRALARDLGERLGTEAHLGGLRRTKSGLLAIEEARTLAEVEGAGDTVADLFADPLRALGLSVVELSDAAAEHVSHGRPLVAEDLAQNGIAAPLPAPGTAVALAHKGSLVAVYECGEAALYAAVVLPEGGV